MMEERTRVRNRSINSADKEDRISALPDSVIQHILTFLPSTKRAIRTSILSKRWRYLWTHVPVLIFKPSNDSGIDYFRFIENTLLLHDCPKIKKFHLQYEDNYQRVDDCQFTSKIRFAIRRCVEELSVICSHVVREYWLPENLFKSASLVRLELVNCDFQPNWRVSWPSLKSLKLDFSGLYFNEGSRGIDNVVSGSPSLESLELRGYISDQVGIVSKSLKILSFVDADLRTALKISCPNLVELSVVVEIWPNCSIPDQMIENVLSGSPHICTLKLVKCYGFDKLVIASRSLKVLHLKRVNTNRIEVFCPNLEKLDMMRCNYKIFQAMNLPTAICATIDYADSREHSSLNEMLEQFQHVNKLTIGSSLFKFVSALDMEGRMSLPSLSSKCLTLNVDCEFGLAIPGIVYTLHSPSLEELIINFEFKNYQDTWDKDLHDYWNSNGYTGLTCLESHLKTVKITGISGNDGKCRLVFEFIEFLLTNAKVLNKMIVALNQPGPDFLFEVSQKLLSFPRYSRSTCIEFL